MQVTLPGQIKRLNRPLDNAIVIAALIKAYDNEHQDGMLEIFWLFLNYPTFDVRNLGKFNKLDLQNLGLFKVCLSYSNVYWLCFQNWSALFPSLIIIQKLK